MQLIDTIWKAHTVSCRYFCADERVLAAGKDAQLCSPCQTSAECGRIGSHTTLPNVVGGLPKGHILAAHFPTVCHHRSCVPLQVPSKDSFCKELKEALQSEELQQQQQTDTGSHSFTLSKLAHSLAEPVKKQLSGRKAFSSRPAARRLTQDVSPSPGQHPPPSFVASMCHVITSQCWSWQELEVYSAQGHGGGSSQYIIQPVNSMQRTVLSSTLTYNKEGLTGLIRFAPTECAPVNKAHS